MLSPEGRQSKILRFMTPVSLVPDPGQGCKYALTYDKYMYNLAPFVGMGSKTSQEIWDRS